VVGIKATTVWWLDIKATTFWLLINHRLVVGYQSNHLLVVGYPSNHLLVVGPIFDFSTNPSTFPSTHRQFPFVPLLRLLRAFFVIALCDSVSVACLLFIIICIVFIINLLLK
jgi:hypothetical protein